MRKIVYVCLLCLSCGCQCMPWVDKEPVKVKEIVKKDNKFIVEEKVKK